MLGSTRPVHPALRDCLSAPLRAYDVSLPSNAVHIGVPSTAATVILAVDEPLDVGWLDCHTQTTKRWCSISGLHLRPALIHTHGRQRGIHVSLTPRGARALFGAPLGAVAGQTVDMADLPRGLRDAEHEAVAGRATWAERLAALELILLRRLDASTLAPDLTAAWLMLCGGASVEHVARETGWSRRHLGTRVRAEFGLSPKQLARLGRFERAHDLLAAGRPLADVAHASGFADQPHLSREWKAFAGRSPSASADPFPYLQDVLAARPQD